MVLLPGAFPVQILTRLFIRRSQRPSSRAPWGLGRRAESSSKKDGTGTYSGHRCFAAFCRRWNPQDCGAALPSAPPPSTSTHVDPAPAACSGPVFDSGRWRKTHERHRSTSLCASGFGALGLTAAAAAAASAGSGLHVFSTPRCRPHTCALRTIATATVNGSGQYRASVLPDLLHPGHQSDEAPLVSTNSGTALAAAVQAAAAAGSNVTINVYASGGHTDGQEMVPIKALLSPPEVYAAVRA